MPGPFLQFDSSRLEASAAEEIWREALRPTYEIRRPKRAPFRAKIEVWDFGSMLLTTHFALDENQFQRTRGKIVSTSTDYYLVHCLLGGELASEFDGQQLHVPIHSVTVRDLAIENIGFSRSAPMVTLTVPRALLDRQLPSGAQLHAVTWGAADPIGSMLAAHIQKVAKLAPELTGEQARVAGEATLGLLASCLLPKAKPTAHRDDPRLAPMLRAQALSCIERRLSDPDLDPAAIGRALGISRTVLYELFASSGGVARYVRARRLDEAMRRLRAPGGPKARIAEIAYGLGFSSETTFCRRFRERFGCAPSDARDGAESTPTSKTVAGLENIGLVYEAKIQSLAA